MKKETTEKPKALTPREAAQDFIRPYVLKGDTMPLHPSVKLRHETENYSAHVERENVVITNLYGVEIKETFSLNEIMLDVTMEYSHSTGMANITAATAVEGYAKRLKEIKVLFKLLSQKLRNHKKRFKENSLNWGYVGDLSHISSKLKELISFIH